MVENELNEFIEGATKVDAWAKWRENLIGLTDVTRSHFSKLVMELEKGLDAMLADYQNGARSPLPRPLTSCCASPWLSLRKVRVQFSCLHRWVRSLYEGGLG